MEIYMNDSSEIVINLVCKMDRFYKVVRKITTVNKTIKALKSEDDETSDKKKSKSRKKRGNRFRNAVNKAMTISRLQRNNVSRDFSTDYMMDEFAQLQLLMEDLSISKDDEIYRLNEKVKQSQLQMSAIKQITVIEFKKLQSENRSLHRKMSAMHEQIIRLQKDVTVIALYSTLRYLDV